MFAVLGEITFVTFAGPSTFAAQRRWDYAEHRVVENTPKLQWIADGLETITLDMLFHVSFTDPVAQLDALITAASDHQARALVFGNGVHRGYFVIASIEAIDGQRSDEGDPIAVSVAVELKQWNMANENNIAQALAPTFTPIGIVAAPAGAATAPLTYSPPAGVYPSIAAAILYAPPALAAAGVSPLLANPVLGAATSAVVSAADVPPSSIVRAAA